MLCFNYYYLFLYFILVFYLLFVGLKSPSLGPKPRLFRRFEVHKRSKFASRPPGPMETRPTHQAFTHAQLASPQAVSTSFGPTFEATFMPRLVAFLFHARLSPRKAPFMQGPPATVPCFFLPQRIRQLHGMHCACPSCEMDSSPHAQFVYTRSCLQLPTPVRTDPTGVPTSLLAGLHQQL